jgi:hypothetical protein
MDLMEMFDRSVREYSYSGAWADAIEDYAKSFATTSAGILTSLVSRPHRYPGNGRDVTLLFGADDKASPTVVSLANDVWASFEGGNDPTRAMAVIRVSREEFARQELHTLLWEAGLSSDDDYLVRQPVDHLRACLLSRRWDKADQIIKDPLGILGNDNAAVRFANWCASYDYKKERYRFENGFPDAEFKSRIRPHEIFGGVALSWIDAAVLDPERAVDLLALAAAMMRYAGFEYGWTGHEEALRSDASASGKKGAHIRHQGTSALKDWALKHAESIRGSDVEIARSLARRLPPDFASVSADPERLIYEALRGARKLKPTDS